MLLRRGSGSRVGGPGGGVGLDRIRRVCDACARSKFGKISRRWGGPMLSEPKWRGVARMLGFAAGSACALVLTSLAIVRGLDAAGIAEFYVVLDAMKGQVKVLEILETSKQRLAGQRIAFLGDSTAMFVSDGARGLDHQLGRALDALAPESPRHRVFSFASPGYTQFTQYFLSHRVAYAKPDVVVLAFNLAAFSNLSREADRPELAAWLPVRQLAEAFSLPLHWIGLSTAELLLYTTVPHVGGFEAWQKLSHEQARCVHAWGSLATWLQARSGAPNGLVYQNLLFYQRRMQQYDLGPPERESEALARSRLGALLAGVGPDHPVLRMLRATLEVFRERGIPVFVYIAPLNIEHLERIGLRDREGLRRGVESVRRVVIAGGASLIDLHDVLPDAAFADGGGHLMTSAEFDAPPIVARRMAQAMRAAGGAR